MNRDIKKLIRWSDAYYNKTPLVSDEEYDAEYERLKKLYPNDEFFNTIGATVNSGDVVQFKNVMGSLNKENPESIIEWLNEQDCKYVLISPKLDGLSLKIKYVNGERVQVATRGDGFTGQDITSRAPYIGGIPKYINLPGVVEVNGECVCYRSLFEKYYSSEYKFPRNFCVGTLRPILSNKVYAELLEENEDLKKRLTRLQFIAFSVNHVNCKPLKKEVSKYSLLLRLEIEGFSTIIKPARRWKYEDHQKYRDKGITSIARCKQDINLPYVVLRDKSKLTPEIFKDLINKVKTELDVNCDGIVVEYDDLKKSASLGLEANGKNPKCARAVKNKAFDQDGKRTIIKDIEWNISKRGNFIPTILLKPVTIEGAEISRVTGNNLAYLKDMGLGIGAEVRLIRSGDVIPRIVETYKKSEKFNEPKVCPYCGKPLKFSDCHPYCSNSKCEGIITKKLITFFQIAKVDYMSWSTVADFVEAGYDTVKKIMTLTPKQIMKLDRYKELKANKIVTNMEVMRKSLNLAQLMHATGMFDNEDTGLAETKLQWIIDSVGIENILKGKSIKKDSLLNIKGISQTTATLFIKGYTDFVNWYKSNGNLFELTDFNEVTGALSDKVFCWTGFRDKNLKQLIEQNGGKIKDNLTKDVDVLFSAGDSSKTKRASALGIKIIPQGKALKYIESIL